jgi:hypothetical protein
MDRYMISVTRFLNLFLLFGLLAGLILFGRASASHLLDGPHGLAAGEESATGGRVLAAPSATASLLLLRTGALVLTTGGNTTVVTAQVLDTKGKPVSGITVNFRSNLAGVTPGSVATNANGIAATTFMPGASLGQAVVVAEAGHLSRETAIQIVRANDDATSHTLSLEPGADKLAPGQQMNVAAVLRDATGQPVAGELVSFFGSLGAVTPASAFTNAEGRILISYRAGSVAGAAKITALAGYASRTATLVVVGPVTNPPALHHFLYLPAVSNGQ